MRDLIERLEARREMAAKAGDATEDPNWFPFSTGESEGVGTIDSRSFWLTLDGMSELTEEQLADRSYRIAEFVAANDPATVTLLLNVVIAGVELCDAPIPSRLIALNAAIDALAAHLAGETSGGNGSENAQKAPVHVERGDL